MASMRVFSMRQFSFFAILCAALAVGAAAQNSSSSSSSKGDAAAQERSSARVRAGLVETTGSGITLESSESLFDMAAALNACGYDADLADSDPVRAEVRADMTAAIAESTEAKRSASELCSYIQLHTLSNPGRSLAQYVSLALYLGPPPALERTADETDMPPDALDVVNILPLLRDFAKEISLHAIWLKHHAEYEAITDKIHDPVTKMILTTNVYLKVPVSSYDGRRMLILVEPLLAPNAPNARIYSLDYVIVSSPTAAAAVRMDQIRHLYLHYEIEPLVYAKSQSMMRLTPLLKPVQTAPLDFVYKTDVVALVTECMIKAIEARTLDVGKAPAMPSNKERAESSRYEEELASYERQGEAQRRKLVELDMRQGWVLVDYFYDQFRLLERTPEGLNDAMGEMVYGMDVGRVQHQAMQIAFLPTGSNEFVTKVKPAPSGLMLAEKKMLSGDLPGAELLADKALADPTQDHGEAMYLKARVILMQGDPEESFNGFEDVVKTSKNPRTLAWAHVYLGRLYDIKQPVERDHALAEYKLALATPGILPDAKTAAEKGLKTPFEVPKVAHSEEEPLDPTGKAEKEAYKPTPPPPQNER
jgi:hypothetical protein